MPVALVRDHMQEWMAKARREGLFGKAAGKALKAVGTQEDLEKSSSGRTRPSSTMSGSS